MGRMSNKQLESIWAENHRKYWEKIYQLPKNKVLCKDCGFSERLDHIPCSNKDCGNKICPTNLPKVFSNLYCIKCRKNGFKD